MNSSASICFDFSKTIDDKFSFYKKTDFMLDAGTAEHIFDVKTTFENIHNMLSINGTACHILPVSWHLHGFYNFTEPFFRAIASKNNYKILLVGYYFYNTAYIREEKKSFFLSKLFAKNNFPFPKICILQRDGTTTLLGAQIEQHLTNGGALPANALLCVAWKKQSDSSFKVPYDIQD